MPDLLTALKHRARKVPIVRAPGRAAEFEGFAVLAQDQTNWCWVSTLQALIGNGIPHWRHGHWVAQEKIAAAVLDEPRCRHEPWLFNEPYDLTELLGELEVTRGVFAGQPSMPAVRLLHGANVMVCWIAWPAGGYHYVIVSGWSQNRYGLIVTVHDPRAGVGRTIATYADLCRAYTDEQGQVAFHATIR